MAGKEMTKIIILLQQVLMKYTHTVKSPFFLRKKKEGRNDKIKTAQNIFVTHQMRNTVV